MTEPRGPVYLCLDVELQESRMPDGFVMPDLNRYRPPAPPSGNPEAITEAAKALRDARWPVLLVEGLGRAPDGPDALQSLAELLGIPVIEQGSAFNLSNLHPLNLTGASVEVLKEADLVLTVGVKDIEAALTRPEPETGIVPAGLPRTPAGYSRRHQSVVRDGAKLVRVGLQDYGIRSWTSSHGRLVPADVAILGSGPLVLREIERHCQSALDADLRRRSAERAAKAREIHTAVATRVQKDLKERWWAQKPISTARLAAEIWDAIRDQDWVLAHGSLSGWERRLWEVKDGSRYIAGGGGTGTGMGVAMGVALAFRGTGKICVSIQNDGDLLYTPGSLWTAAHHRIPMLIVMFNNRSYYQDVGHQLSVTRMRQRPLDNIGIGVNLEGPATDFATLAKSFGIYGDGPILDPDAIRGALERGLKVVKEKGTPALIDTVTQPR
jgi:acetolactate synthase I/II/III large subunit